MLVVSPPTLDYVCLMLYPSSCPLILSIYLIQVCIAGSRLQRALGLGKVAHERLDEMMDMSVFTPEELERLKTEFTKAASGTGGKSLNLAHFKEIMGNLGFGHLPLERIFRVFDTNGTGDIDCREFLIGISKFRLKGPDALKCKLCICLLDWGRCVSVWRDDEMRRHA